MLKKDNTDGMGRIQSCADHPKPGMPRSSTKIMVEAYVAPYKKILRDPKAVTYRCGKVAWQQVKCLIQLQKGYL
jgi:hypothetical protein